MKTNFIVEVNKDIKAYYLRVHEGYFMKIL